MKHEFTLRENILILICTILALGIFYYEFAYRPLQNQITLYNTDNLTTDLTIAETKAAKYNQMKNAIAENSESTGEIAVYDNLSNEVAEFASILNGSAQDISIAWGDPVLNGTIVRRSAQVSFNTSSYAAAKDLVRMLAEGQYRNVITDLSISSNTDLTFDTSDDVNVSMNVTFFETTDGASTTQGLIIPDDNSSTDDTESQS